VAAARLEHARDHDFGGDHCPREVRGEDVGLGRQVAKIELLADADAADVGDGGAEGVREEHT